MASGGINKLAGSIKRGKMTAIKSANIEL